MTVNKQYALGANQGDSRWAAAKYVVLHESGNNRDTLDPQAVLHEVQYMHNNWTSAYATYFVGGGGQVYQIGEPGYVAWAALGANPYAPVQIELARTANKETFLKDYAAYIGLARDSAKRFGIPLSFDAGSAGTPGIKSHAWCTQHHGGDHVDPFDYMASWGITRERLAHDLANGIETKPEPIDPNRIEVRYKPGYGVNALDSNGRQIKGSNLTLKHGTAWHSNGIAIICNRICFDIGRGWWLPQEYTQLAGICRINYKAGYGINAWDANGRQIGRTNLKLKHGTAWKSTQVRKIKGEICYEVSSTEFVPAKYVFGSGKTY